MIATLLDIVMHIDQHLLLFFQDYGFWVYVLLAAIVFSETGLIVFAFLPGDSLLFAAGSLAAGVGADFDIGLLFLLLVLSSIFGNKINYLIGRFCGRLLLNNKRFAIVSHTQLERAQSFYDEHGGKTIILARFIPFIRTFVPFVAGMSRMNMKIFAFYNIVSAVIWIGSLLFAGYWFGSLPVVKEHFSMIVYAIILLSLCPVFITALSRK